VVGPLVVVVSLSRWTGDAARGSRDLQGSVRWSPALNDLQGAAAGCCLGERCTNRANGARQGQPARGGVRGGRRHALPSVRLPVPCQVLPLLATYSTCQKQRSVCASCVAEHSAGRETHLSPTRVEPPSRPTQHKTL
jgi:hypothetical protein